MRLSPKRPKGSPVDVPIITRLKTRPDFLAAARGLTCGRGAVNAQVRHRQDETPVVRIGFTATRRIGGAVVRNRAKRRLREAARIVAPLHVVAGCDYVFIARGGTPTRPWNALLEDMASALKRLAADLRATLPQAAPPTSEPATFMPSDPMTADQASPAP